MKISTLTINCSDAPLKVSKSEFKWSLSGHILVLALTSITRKDVKDSGQKRKELQELVRHFSFLKEGKEN